MTDFSAAMVDRGKALDHLLALLAIEGLSGRETAVSAEVERRLREAGCNPSWLHRDSAHKRIGSGYETGNLIVRIPGKGALRSAPRRLFAGHMDTVPICRGAVPKLSGERIVPDGRTALGGDNRTAVAALVTVAEILLRNQVDRPPLTLLFTVGEETGLRGSREVKLSDLGYPELGFNVDGGSPEFAVTGAIAADRWRADVHGRSAHAGVHPERGISAALIASRAIAAVAEQGYFGAVDIDGRKGTSNVGMMNGGEATNQVTDHVRVVGESRSHSNSFLNRITATYRRAFEQAAGSVRNNRGEKGSIEFVSQREYNAFRLPRNSAPVRIAANAIRALGHDPKLAIADGGLDANNLTAKGVPTVTLGAGQHNPHTVDEFIEVAEYIEGCGLLAMLAAGFGNEA